MLQLCRECNQPGLCHFLRLPIRLPDSVKLFACQIICMPVSPWQLVGVLQPDVLMLNPKIDCSSAKLSCHVAALAVPTLTSRRGLTPARHTMWKGLTCHVCASHARPMCECYACCVWLVTHLSEPSSSLLAAGVVAWFSWTCYSTL